jgi:hypothetical protein
MAATVEGPAGVVTWPSMERSLPVAGGQRSRRDLVAGARLSREIIRAWMKTLPDGWCANRGESPFRRKRR